MFFITLSTIERTVTSVIYGYLHSDTVKNRAQKANLDDLYAFSRKIFIVGNETLIQDNHSDKEAETHKEDAKSLSLRYKNARDTMVANSKAKREA